MSFNRRPQTARLIVSRCGLWPTAAAALALSLLPSAAWAQGADPAAAPAKVRDPMKPGASDNKDAKVVVSEHMTVDLHVKDEDLSNVLELLSIQTQKNIIASKNVAAKVTATLYGVTFYQALDAILHVNNFGYLENGNFIYVYTKDELKQIEAALKKRVSKTIKLNYLNADDAKEFVTPLLSKDGGEIKINTKPAAFSIPDKAPVGKNDYALGDTMVIFDYEENVKAIEELIKQIDTRPSQVLVEATILQTSLNEANAFGVDFSIVGDVSFLDFINTGGPLSAANALIRGGKGTDAKQGFTPPNNRGVGVTSTVGNTEGPGGFKVGVIAGDVSIFLKMLDQVTDTVMLSNPKVLALNRQPARVLVGKRVGYLSTTSTDTSTTQSVQFLDTGTQLFFRPFVSSDGEIRLELKPSVSAAELREQTDSTGSQVTIPDEFTQELTTNVNVRDGQTIVLGGLFTESTSFTRRQVPWAGDLPIIGAAFRGNDDKTERSEIIFLITPTIITDTAIASAAERANNDIERVRTGSRQGLLPWSRHKMTETLNVEAERLARDGDYDKALWNIQRSLSLNANQPQAYALRERITGQREVWPNPSLLDQIMDTEVDRRIDSIKPAPPPVENLKPRGSVKIPMEPMPAPAPGGSSMSTPSGRSSTPSGTQASSSPHAPSTPAASSSGAAGDAMSATDSVTSAALLNNSDFDDSKLPPLDSGMNIGTSTPGAPVPAVASSQNAPANPADKYVVPELTDIERTDIAQVRTQVSNLRAQIDLFTVMNSGTRPALGRPDQDGWQDLTSAQLINEGPANPYVGGANSRKVVIGDKPDTRYHTDYGWVYNPATGQLWAAGFDHAERPLAKSTAAAKPAQPQNAPATATVPTPLSANTKPAQDLNKSWSSMFGLTPDSLLNAFREQSTPAASTQPAPASEPATAGADPDAKP